MKQVVTETAVSCGQSEDCGIYALAMAANDAAAQGVAQIDMRVKFLIPVPIYKEKMAGLTKAVKSVCTVRQFDLKELTGIRSTISTQCMVLATASGEVLKEPKKDAPIAPGQEIIQIGYAGLEGALLMAGEKEEAMKNRFTPAFLSRLHTDQQYLFEEDIAGKLRAAPVNLIRQVKDGGILSALYQLAEETDLGVKADLKAMPVLQESVEVCEYFRKNPYQMTSAGTFLVLCSRAEDVLKICREEKIPAAVIGKMTSGPDKIIQSGEEEQYINRPGTDELMNFYMGGF